MDVQMPEADGFEATAAIRKKEEATGAHLPVVAMTAHAMQGDRERCLAAGMDGYLSKPVGAKELLSVIQAAMQSSKMASEAQAAPHREPEIPAPCGRRMRAQGGQLYRLPAESDTVILPST